ncbi:MAG: HNH endonuclease [Dehalococcoidia bacterium]
MVRITGPNGQRTEAIHRMVARAFLGAPAEYEEVNHIDLDPGNNHLVNLEYVTHHANVLHAVAGGRFADRRKRLTAVDVCGERNPRARLTRSAAAAIRERYAAGESYAALARTFGVAKPTIGNVVRGETWR